MMIVNSNKLFINSLESNINKNYNIELKNNLSATNFKSALDHFLMVLSAVKISITVSRGTEASRDKLRATVHSLVPLLVLVHE